MQSIAAPTASAFTAFKAADRYPFEHLRGREDEALQLSTWLDEIRKGTALGGAALVTGFRGVGKTSLVNKVLFDAGMASLHNVGFSVNPTWGPFGLEEVKKFDRPPKEVIQIQLPIRVDIASPISPADLMRRIVRTIYFTMVEHQIGAVDARIVQRARAAYLRTLGELSIESMKRVQVSFGVDLKKLASMPLEIGMEAELAQTIRQVVGELSIEEAEEEILGISAHAEVLGERAFWSNLEQIGQKSIQKMWTECLKKIKDSAGIRVHPVLVLDELDKLEDPEEGALRVTPILQTSQEIVRMLKPLLSSRHLHVIAIGGWRMEDAWLAEQSHPDPILRSLFSRHVYVRSARPADLAYLLRNDRPMLSEYVSLRTRGRYKDAIRVATELDRDHHEVLREHLAVRLRDWGSFDISELKGPGSPSAGLDSAETLEDLVRALSMALPPLQANRFGVDYIRAVLAGCVFEFATSSSDAIAGASDTLRGAADRVANEETKRVPASFWRSALYRLIGWLQPAPQPGGVNPPAAT